MTSRRPHLHSWLIMAAIVVVAVVAYRGVRARPADPHAPLRDTIAVLRAQADSCMSRVDSGAASMRTYDRRLDSMRARIRELEALDTRGVPVDSFALYMSAFNAYNDSAAAWPPREDSLRAMNARCRVVAVRHNALADSLRSLVLPSAAPGGSTQ